MKKLSPIWLAVFWSLFLTGSVFAAAETVLTLPFGRGWDLLPPYVLNQDGKVCGVFSGAYLCLSSNNEISSWQPIIEENVIAGQAAYGFYLPGEEKFIYLIKKDFYLSGIEVSLSGTPKTLGPVDLREVSSSLAQNDFTALKDPAGNIFLCPLASVGEETLCYAVSLSGGLHVDSTPKALADLTKPLEGALGGNFSQRPFYALIPQGADYVVWQYDLSSGQKVVFNAYMWPYLCGEDAPSGAAMEGCLPLRSLTYEGSYVDSYSGPLRVAVAGQQAFLAFRFKDYWRETYGEENLFFLSGSVNDLFGSEGTLELSGHAVTNLPHNPDYLFANSEKVWVYHYGIWHEIVNSQAEASLATIPPSFNEVLFTGGKVLYPVREPLDETYQYYKLYLVSISPHPLKIQLFPVPGNLSSSSSLELYSFAAGFLLSFSGEEGPFLLSYDPEGNLRAQMQPASLGSFVGYDADDQLLIFSDESTYLYDLNLTLKATLPYSAVSAVVIEDYFIGAEGGFLRVVRLADGQLVKTFSVPTFTDLTENGNLLFWAGNEGTYLSGALEPAIFSAATLSQLLQAEVWPAPRLRYYGGGNVYPAEHNGQFYILGKKSLLVRPEANGHLIVKGSAPLPFEPASMAYHPVFFENDQAVLYLAESDSPQSAFLQLKRYGLDFHSVPLEQAQEFHLDWRDKIGAYPAPLDFPFGIEGIMHDETGLHPWSSDGQIELRLSLPTYDTPYDVYLAYLDQTGLHFFTSQGIKNEPLPLWSGLEDGIFVDFGRFPFEILPRGDYYLMVRQAGTAAFDFENPGYIVWQLWRIP